MSLSDGAQAYNPGSAHQDFVLGKRVVKMELVHGIHSDEHSGVTLWSALFPLGFVCGAQCASGSSSKVSVYSLAHRPS